MLPAQGIARDGVFGKVSSEKQMRFTALILVLGLRQVSRWQLDELVEGLIWPYRA
jgi:hypothetical protein